MRSAVLGQGPAARSLLALQRQLGNRHVGEALRRKTVATAPDCAAPTLERIGQEIGTARGAGNGLDAGVREEMESAFGVDFGPVRVHTDARADRLGQALSARAFTTGHDIFFREGEYDMCSSGGRELLAHELTHVVQQGCTVARQMTVSQPGDPEEIEAEETALAVVRREGQCAAC